MGWFLFISLTAVEVGIGVALSQLMEIPGEGYVITVGAVALSYITALAMWVCRKGSGLSNDRGSGRSMATLNGLAAQRNAERQTQLMEERAQRDLMDQNNRY